MSEGSFDGVVCFGGVDWWYHNRGHYDLQMMRELSGRVPVLYVNSIAMRVPKLGSGGQFVRRVGRKLASLRRGLVEVRPGFGVYSPFVVPGPLGTRVSRAFGPLQVRRAARRMGIRRPLVWVACPPAVRFVGALAPVGLLWQRTDRHEAFAGVDPDFIGACNRELEATADATLFCSHSLMAEEEEHCRRAWFVDHGVDYDVFRAAGERPDDVPEDVARLPRPRVGFVGGIDAHTFDPSLFLAVARALPGVSFFLVGGCSLPEGWCTLANVHLLGRRPYEQVARYMAAADVLIMPWNQSPWVRAANPVKLKEYLAVGRPIVSTGFDELERYTELVRAVEGPEAFAGAISEALEGAHDPEPGRRRVAPQTWGDKAGEVLRRLAEVGLEPARSGEALSPRAPRGAAPPR